MFSSVRTLLVGGLVGKILGVARELVSASLLGTGLVATAYRLSQAAFVIPLNGLMSESLSSGFTPTYSRERVAAVETSRALFAGMHAVLLMFSTVIGLLTAFFATQWVRLLAPGLDSQTLALTSQMVRIMVWAMPLFSLTSLCAAAELAAGKAEMAAARASIQSIGLIVGTVLAWKLSRPILLPTGFVLAYVCLSVWGIRLVRVDRLKFWPRAADWSLGREALGRVWRAFCVVFWIPVIMQVHFIVERRVASIVNPNAVAALDYARFVSETAVLLLAMPFGVAGLAAMARMDEEQFQLAASRSLRMLLFIGIPISFAIALNADWVVRIIFARGAFGADSIVTTASILRGIGAGLWAQLLGIAGVKFLSARGHNRAVVGIYVVALVSNIALNLLLSHVLGVTALGVAAGAGSIILGLAITARLGLLTSLCSDLIALMGTATGYLVVSLIVPGALAGQRWFPPALFLIYWGAVVAVIHRYREVFLDMWIMLRPARVGISGA